MDTFAIDGLIVVGLLAGSAGCVAGCLWLAHRVGLAEVLERAEGGTIRFRGLRMGLGLVALGVCLVMMTGVLPGTAFLHGWTSLACVGCGLLGIVTMSTAQRERSQSMSQSMGAQPEKAQTWRKAA